MNGHDSLRPSLHRYRSDWRHLDPSRVRELSPGANRTTGGHRDGTRVKQPGANSSLAEKGTRKRTANCAAHKLTLANCWLILFLMSDPGVCDLIRRGEHLHFNVFIVINHGLTKPQLPAGFEGFIQRRDNERGSVLQGANGQLAC